MGESPVIEMDVSGTYVTIAGYITTAVNFLRSGCPSVQIFYSYTAPEDSNFKEEFDELSANMKSILNTLSLPKESFKVEEIKSVLLITRVVEK